ncbi:hypothetical protein DJ73_17680 [Halorubrum sp. Ea1]|uniref:hypothetical protein n=1 Tax=Halorubrum sp. Ea1 TaxID=1480718 RepID=UPI000B986FC8|nr:hypothetical protein [Halorubrum sp. Ea1]OYR49504.1 hypothetical protein DJ73_17680 [Halorubrum sp. Ea1]
MNLDELRSAQAKERRKDSLQHLRDSFYDDVAAYVADLRAARDRRAEQVDKPFSDDDVRRLSDEVETAEEVAEALYERRVGKVVKLASFAAADMPVDADGMTTEERKLFDDLVDRIGENKSRVLDVLSGEVSVDQSASGSASGTGSELEPASAPDGARAERGPTESAAPDAPEEPAPPAPDPEPADRSNPIEQADAAEDESGGVADALAGAMGGGDDEVADALDATPGETAESSDLPPTDAPERNASDVAGDGATTDGGPTAVPPEPAPPGAPGGDGRATAGDVDSTDETGASPGADPADSADSVDDDRATVRITRDVGAIFGVDEREYDLASEDVVSLPVENAAPLVERDAAERLD